MVLSKAFDPYRTLSCTVGTDRAVTHPYGPPGLRGLAPPSGASAALCVRRLPSGASAVRRCGLQGKAHGEAGAGPVCVLA